MTPRFDPRTVPRGQLLSRHGRPRPSISIVAFLRTSSSEVVARRRQALGQNDETQWIIAQCRDAQSLYSEGPLRQADQEALPAFAKRAAERCIGEYLVLLPPGVSEDQDLAALIKRFAADPWLGAIELEGLDPGWHGLMTRESLWTALDGFDPAYSTWSWALNDFYLRARAIGYGAPAPSSETTVSGCEAVLFAQRRIDALDRSPAAETGSSWDAPQVVLYTAITQAYDTLKPQPAPVVDHAQLAFLDHRTADTYSGGSRGWRIVPMASSLADPHRQARFYKINAHLALPEAQYSLWIDASIGITCPYPLSRLAALFLAESDFCVFHHYARKSIFEEADVCKVLGLDRPDLIDAQITRYRREGLPEDAGLIEAPILLRRHTSTTRAFNQAWWAELERGSRRDQLSFNYVAWKLDFKYCLFPLSLAIRNGLFIKFKRACATGQPSHVA